MYLYEGGEMIAYNRHKTIEAQAQWQKEQNYTFWQSNFQLHQHTK